MPRFSKYSGAGNDFVIVRAEEIGLDDPTRLALRICSRATGVGVDGLILIRSLSEELVRIRFFNPDGSEFATCGNGTRCAARYAHERGLVPEPSFDLVTDDGEVGATIDGVAIALDYRLEARVERAVETELDGAARRGWLVRVGTPHLVIPVDAFPEPFEDAVRPIRLHESLGPDGANVDLVRLTGPDETEVRTFERGVEGETLACGSGAIAVALALREAELAGPILSLRTRSGATLSVELVDDGSTIRLSGPARHIFDGVYPDR